MGDAFSEHAEIPCQRFTAQFKEARKASHGETYWIPEMD